MDTRENHDRRASGGQPRAPLGEMPVLFQLADLNRSRFPKQPILPPPTGVVGEPMVERAPPPATLAFPNAPHDPGDSLAASTALGLAPPVDLVSSELARELAAAAEISSRAEPESISTPSAVAETKPESGSASAPDRRQQRVEQRSRREATSTRGDWFQSHGKLLALGFVVALCVTIYVARTKRTATDTGPEPPEITWSIEHPGDAAAHVGAEASSSTEIAQGSPPTIELPPPTAKPAAPASEPSPAASDSFAAAEPAQSPEKPEAAPTDPQVSLHLPTPAVPPADKPAAEEGSRDPLFPWPQNEARVATRPDAPTDAAGSPTPATAPAPTGQPAPQFIPNPTMPSAAPAPAAAPPAANNPASPADDDGRSPYLMPNRAFGAPTSQPQPQPSAASAPAPMSPPPSAPNGYRHERTGSGLY